MFKFFTNLVAQASKQRESGALSTTTTFPIHSDHPTSTSNYPYNYKNPLGSHSQSTHLPSSHFPIHLNQPRRSRTPPSAYINPLFVGSTNWLNGSKKGKGWYAKMLEFIRQCWSNRPTQSSENETSNSSRGHKRTQSEVQGRERNLRANDREYNDMFGYAVSLYSNFNEFCCLE